MNRIGMVVKKFLLLETGTYNPQYRRPYNTNLDGRSLGIITENLAGSTSYEPSLIGKIANQFIRPAGTPEKVIEIAGQWDNRRLQFMMEVETTFNQFGGSIREIILGYTNHVGIAGNSAIDPNMEFYVNSTIKVRDSVANTSFGRQEYNSVLDNSHILADNNWTGIMSPIRDQRLRPEDVISTMSRGNMSSTKNVYDARAVSTINAAKSRRSNAMASNYMSHLLNGYINTSKSLDTTVSEERKYSTVRGQVKEELVSADAFLSAIAQIRGTGIGNVFSFGNLQALDRGIEHVTKVQLLNPVAKAQAHNMGQTSGWGGSDLETVTATILSQAVPSLAMDLALTKIAFVATNRNFNGSVAIAVANVDGFASGDLSQHVENFRFRMENEVLRDISFNNEMDFAIEMRVDLLGETFISLSINSGPTIDYVTPSFCDALMAPVITSSDELATTIATDFEQLAIGIMDAGSDMHVLPVLSSGI